MPLTPTTPEPICEADTVSFTMLDGESFVRIDVHRALLERMTPRRTLGGYLDAVRSNRSAFERIASKKYDEGDFRSFANSCVVPIGSADIARFSR